MPELEPLHAKQVLSLNCIPSPWSVLFREPEGKRSYIHVQYKHKNFLQISFLKNGPHCVSLLARNSRRSACFPCTGVSTPPYCNLYPPIFFIHTWSNSQTAPIDREGWLLIKTLIVHFNMRSDKWCAWLYALEHSLELFVHWLQDFQKCPL